jgi:hypothetical protein
LSVQPLYCRRSDYCACDPSRPSLYEIMASSAVRQIGTPINVTMR